MPPSRKQQKLLKAMAKVIGATLADQARADALTETAAQEKPAAPADDTQDS